jgi:hypothetical protein
MRRLLVTTLTTALVQGGAWGLAAAPAHASTCDVGDNIGPVAVSSLAKKYQQAATGADVNRNGLVCGQSYFSVRTGQLVGIHWSDDRL